MEAGGLEALTGRIEERELSQEMRSSYLDYAMSVIVGRALPDVRDGMKPVHRRVLYAMHDLGLQPNRPYRKCAFIVGEVMGKAFLLAFPVGRGRGKLRPIRRRPAGGDALPRAPPRPPRHRDAARDRV